jgi:hypothetical protein
VLFESAAAGRPVATAAHSTGGKGSTAIAVSKDGFTVDAEFVAQGLGLAPDGSWQELNRGIVYGVVEWGEGADVGRTRLTFRYRSRTWCVTLEGVVQ